MTDPELVKQVFTGHQKVFHAGEGNDLLQPLLGTWVVFRFMPRGDHHRTPTVSEAVRDAAAIVDPGDSDDAIMALYEIYEDDDRPVTAVEDLAGTLVATAEGIDPEGDDGAVLACAAAAAWLGMNPRDRNEDHEADHVLREGARMAFGKEPPRQVVAYLATRSVGL